MGSPLSVGQGTACPSGRRSWMPPRKTFPCRRVVQPVNHRVDDKIYFHVTCSVIGMGKKMFLRDTSSVP